MSVEPPIGHTGVLCAPKQAESPQIVLSQLTCIDAVSLALLQCIKTAGGQLEFRPLYPYDISRCNRALICKLSVFFSSNVNKLELVHQSRRMDGMKSGSCLPTTEQYQK